jgi:hypothetical protein
MNSDLMQICGRPLEGGRLRLLGEKYLAAKAGLVCS